jgi:hypothetical protein
MNVAWAAGFFDGEGTVGVWQLRKRGRVYYYLSVSVGQVDRRPLVALQGRYGGSLGLSIRPTGHAAWKWQLVTQAAALFLADIRPYLMVKQEQVDLALTFQTRRHAGRDGRSGYELAEQQAVYEAMKEVKHERSSVLVA